MNKLQHNLDKILQSFGIISLPCLYEKAGECIHMGSVSFCWCVQPSNNQLHNNTFPFIQQNRSLHGCWDEASFHTVVLFKVVSSIYYGPCNVSSRTADKICFDHSHPKLGIFGKINRHHEPIEGKIIDSLYGGSKESCVCIECSVRVQIRNLVVYISKVKFEVRCAMSNESVAPWLLLYDGPECLDFFVQFLKNIQF